MAIFWVLLLLMAAVDINQLLFYSEVKGIVCEKERREEILQKLKEQEASIRLLYSRLKKEIANLEGRQEDVTKPALVLKRQIQQCICKVLSLAVEALGIAFAGGRLSAQWRRRH